MIQEAEFNATTSKRVERDGLPRAQRLAILIPAVIFVSCFVIAMTHAIRVGGVDMWAGYGFGFLFQLLFGFIAALAASELQPRTMKPYWLAVLRIAAVFALFDAAHIWLAPYQLTEFIALGIVSVFLLCMMFGWRGIRGVILAMLIFMIKIIGNIVIANTWLTWF